MFKGRHLDKSDILLCVRWYLNYNLSLRNLKGMMTVRGITMDRSTMHHWVLYFSPQLHERFNRKKRPVISDILRGGVGRLVNSGPSIAPRVCITWYLRKLAKTLEWFG